MRKVVLILVATLIASFANAKSSFCADTLGHGTGPIFFIPGTTILPFSYQINPDTYSVSFITYDSGLYYLTVIDDNGEIVLTTVFINHLTFDLYDRGYFIAFVTTPDSFVYPITLIL